MLCWGAHFSACIDASTVYEGTIFKCMKFKFCLKQLECSQLSQAAKLLTRQILAGNLYGSNWAWKCNLDILPEGYKLQQVQLTAFQTI